MSRVLVRRVLALVFVAAAVACTEGTGPGAMGQLRLRAVFAPGEDPATLGLAVSDIRIIVRRNGGAGPVAIDTTMPFEAGATLAWILELAAPPEPIGISAALAQGSLPLYAGTGQASVDEGIDPASGSVTDVPVQFLGLPVASVDITPDSATTAALGETRQFSAVARDARGVVVPGVAFTWSSSATNVATIDTAGRATGAASGTTTITVTSGGVSDSARLKVTQVVASVAVTPDSITVFSGDSAKYTASARDANGHLINGVTWTWASTDSSVASITGLAPDTGLAVAIDSGRTIISASAGGVADSSVLIVLEDDGGPGEPPGPIVSITVSPPFGTITALGQTQQFTAVARDADGTVVPNTTFTWTSDDIAVATVNAAGLATGWRQGLTTVRASADGRSGTASLVVVQVATSVSIVPASAIVATGDSAVFTAVALDATGNVIPSATIVWSSTDATVATVSVSGVATGVTAGTVGVRATAGSASATATFQVVSVGSVTVLPGNEPKAFVNDTVRFTAVVRDAAGNVVTGLKVTWSSSKPTVASVDSSTGLATALNVGFTRITAKVGGVTGFEVFVIRP